MTDVTVGDRIALVSMPHDPAPIPAGSTGVVEEIVTYEIPQITSFREWDDLGRPGETLGTSLCHGQLWVRWDEDPEGSRRSLSLLIGIDEYEVVQ